MKRSTLIINILVVLSIYTCAQPTHADSSSHKDDKVVVSSDMYGDKIFQMLEVSPSLERVKNILEPLQGYEAQITRLLLWAKESDPIVRKELLKQMFCNIKDSLDQGAINNELLKYVSSHTEQDLTTRTMEIKQVFMEKHNDKRDVIICRGSESILPEFDLLYDAKAVWGTNILDLGPHERLNLYRHFPVPIVSEHEPPRGQLYILLWLIEPNREIQNTLLLPSLINVAYGGSRDEKQKFLIGLLKCMKVPEVTQRSQAVKNYITDMVYVYPIMHQGQQNKGTR